MYLFVIYDLMCTASTNISTIHIIKIQICVGNLTRFLQKKCDTYTVTQQETTIRQIMIIN